LHCPGVNLLEPRGNSRGPVFRSLNIILTYVAGSNAFVFDGLRKAPFYFCSAGQQGCPGGRARSEKRSANTAISKIRESLSKKRTGAEPNCEVCCGRDFVAGTFAASGTLGPVLQNNNVSFTMSDKSAIPFGKLVRPSCWLILLLINHP
jgi:hypothetical protein